MKRTAFLYIRCPQELLDELDKVAREAERSRNAEVLYRLRKSLAVSAVERRKVTAWTAR